MGKTLRKMDKTPRELKIEDITLTVELMLLTVQTRTSSYSDLSSSVTKSIILDFLNSKVIYEHKTHSAVDERTIRIVSEIIFIVVNYNTAMKINDSKTIEEIVEVIDCRLLNSNRFGEDLRDKIYNALKFDSAEERVVAEKKPNMFISFLKRLVK